jgi:hypothetical protein
LHWVHCQDYQEVRAKDSPQPPVENQGVPSVPGAIINCLRFMRGPTLPLLISRQ